MDEREKDPKNTLIVFIVSYEGNRNCGKNVKKSGSGSSLGQLL